MGYVYVKDFGAKGDGLTNDTTAIQNALNSLGNTGGTVMLEANGKYRISTNIIVPKGVHLMGHLEIVGVPGLNGDEASKIWDYGSRLILNSSAQIQLYGASSISRCFIVREGMTAPVLNSSSYAGTALYVYGEDVLVEKCLVIGFNKLLLSEYFGRLTVRDVKGDCNNGFDIIHSLDVTRLEDCHLWPFGTIGYASKNTTPTTSNSFYRNGVAYKFSGIVDWGKMTNCFSFGYMTGFELSDVGSVSLVGCGADGVTSTSSPYTIPGTKGFYIHNDCPHTTMIDCRTAAQDDGIYLDSTDSNADIRIIGCTVHACTKNAINVAGMDVMVSNCRLRGYWDTNTGIGNPIGNGIYINDANSDCLIFGNTINSFDKGINGGNYSKSLANDNRFYNNTIDISNMPFASIASADPLNLSSIKHAHIVSVTGTTGFGSMTATYPGHIVTLKFASSLIVYDGGNIKLAGSFSATADDTLTLICDGTNWIELSRSAN